MCSKRQQLFTTSGVLHKAMKWVLLQDLTYVISQMEPEQKDAFTSSTVNLVESPHLKVVHLRQDKWLINIKHFKNSTVKCNKQSKLMFLKKQGVHMLKGNTKNKKRKKHKHIINTNPWLQHRHDERMSEMMFNSQL